MTDIASVLAWLADGARSAPSDSVLLQQLGEGLSGAGLPVERIAMFVRVLHPDIAARSFVWVRGQSTVAGTTGYDLLASESFLSNPLVQAQQGDVTIRMRPGDREARGSALLEGLWSDGFTDYYATPLHFVSGEIQVASWATRLAGGFTEQHLDAIRQVERPLARVAEIHHLRRAAETLLETYLGRQTGARVLAGHIRRGDTESIQAAIWLSDLRGFTALADLLSPPELIALLDRYFECQVPAIEAHGGEVLKFMGDGWLAIFPIGADGPAPVCAAALAAAREARARVLEMAGDEGQHLRRPPFSLALHLGEVLYGNVGGGHRLDFTVIGPAVNLASRLEVLGRDLGRTLMASGAFAALCGEPLAPLETLCLRGIAAPQPAFGLAEEVSSTP